MPNLTTQIVPFNMFGVVVGTSAVQLVGKNPARNGLIIVNLSAANTVSIANSQTPTPVSLAAGTLTIAVSSNIQFFSGPVAPTSLIFGFAWTDAVNAIASGASTNVTVIEF